MTRHDAFRSKADVHRSQTVQLLWKLAIAALLALALTFALSANRAHAGGKYLAGAIFGGIVAGAILHHSHRHHRPVRIVRHYRPAHVYHPVRVHRPVIVVPRLRIGVYHGW